MQWNDSFATSVREVDDEHRALFRLCDALESRLEAGAETSEIQALAADVIIHAAHHFAHEERQMRAAGYSLYGWHRSQHQNARRRLRTYEQHLRRGEREKAAELVSFLSGWLNEHVRLADRMFGAFMRNHDRELTARAS